MTKFMLKLAAAVVALSAASSAFANVTLSSAPGAATVFLTLENSSTNTTFVFDTGLTQATFNSNGNYSFSLSADANYQAFLSAGAGTAANPIFFGVYAADNTGSAPRALWATVSNFTGNVANNQGLSQASSRVVSFEASVTNYALNFPTPGTTSVFALPSNDPAVAFSSATPDQQLRANTRSLIPQTALDFYAFTTGTGGSFGSSIRTAFAGQWLYDQVSGLLTYTSAVTAVPLPPALTLMLGGLALMGLISRRRKTVAESGGFFGGGTAA